MPDSTWRDHMAVVLVRPRISENIGAAARAMCNMGIERLLVVDPVDYDPNRARTLATHAAAHLLDRVEFFPDLPSALAGFHWVVGTTARLGGQREAVIPPARVAPDLIATAGAGNQVAMVFGPEDRGLTNQDLRRCHQLIHIPTSDFSSINLAQSVMILCYELSRSDARPSAPAEPRLAVRYELDGMYAQLSEMLVRINYINPENPDYWMHKIRQFFTRLRLRGRDVSIIRGICRQMDWYAGKRYRDGLADGQKEMEP